jgi:hypothetical protein
VPAPRAIIDADVLYRRHPRNLLVWHAIVGLYELHWSARIVTETRASLMERNCAAFGEPRAAAVDRVLRRVTDALLTARAGEAVPEAEIAARARVMPNHPKDRHVLAAAIATGAGTIVTTNVRDFAPEDIRPLGVVALTPDEFLTSLLNARTADAALAALQRHATFHGWSLAELLTLLSTADGGRTAIAPQYAGRIRALIGS